ncbi:MAG: hypothetical protein ABFS46_16560, partial [Myxococcota bacterium]
MRSFDQRHHTYLGYALLVRGEIGEEAREAWLGVGRAAQEKHEFQVGMKASGRAVPVVDSRMEPVEFYKVTGVKVIPGPAQDVAPPPWHGVAPEIAVYRKRGHRRLASQTYASRCVSCIWGARMPVEMIIDHWNPDRKKYRFETFCYGPKSCNLYRAGPRRKVPGRRGKVWEEADWVDEEETA